MCEVLVGADKLRRVYAWLKFKGSINKRIWVTMEGMMRVLLKCWSATSLATQEDAREKDFFNKIWWVTFLNVFMLKSFLWFSFTSLKDDFKWECVLKRDFYKKFICAQ